MPPFILLASASPRRHEILDQLAIPHGLLRVPAPAGEDEPQLPGEPAADYVRRTARDKAQRAVAWLAAGGLPAPLPRNWPAEWRDAPILCADTTVILDGDVLGKPRDAADAAAMLRRLSGREHAVHTAVVLADRGRLFETVSVSTVRFQTLTNTDIATYIDSGEPFGKAGSYAIQGRAAAFVAHLAGSHSGVMGLPAHETVQLLTQCQD
ncbi:MAG: Maf family protein [Castellaniella sp.]|uniref:Maf family protein n=1 Tax=Castellaniella sp. TaxID=1955812 RepID=UPI002A36A848|nr:Maf family protein [Castellaniella sp.]MDY0309461.1 Maf family protein [Castellaniella sp.]